MERLRNKLFEHNHFHFFMAICGVVFKTGVAVYTAFLLMDFTNVAIDGNIDDLKDMLFVFVFYIIAYMVSDSIMFYFKNRFIQRGITQYKKEAFSHVLKKHIASFQKETTSHYTSALTNDVNSIEINYMEGSFQIVYHELLFIGSLATMAYLNVTLTLCVILACLVPLLISVIFGKPITSAEQKTSQNNARFTALIKDLLSGFTIIKSFQSEKQFMKNYNAENDYLETQKRKKRDLVAIITVIAECGGLSVNLAIFGVGTYLTMQGDLTAGTLIAFVQLSNFVISPLQMLPSFISNFIASKALIEKMEKACENEQDQEGINYGNFKSCIEIKNLSFAYEENQSILKDISITFEKGKSYAIVGGSGSGKSTLLQLLLGYHSFDGEIRIDDKNLQDIKHDSLYELMSMIQQNVFLFDDSIRNNITMLKEFDENHLMQAIEMAGLLPLWEEKTDTYHCGENGCHLSGGEKQRISIARSLLKETPILMMDEATSALDSITAKHVEDAIFSIPSVTKLIVTHKLKEDMLKRYDEIIVLGNQKVLEKGKFEELYDKKGYFYALYKIQN